MFDELVRLIEQQQNIPFVMLAFTAVGFVIIFERFIALFLVYRINFKKFNLQIRKMLEAGDLERARSFCLATSKSGAPYIATKAIDAFQNDSFRVRNVMIEETLDFMPKVHRRIPHLPLLAACGVFLGSLGALEGVWNTFKTANILDYSMRAGVLTNGLGSAFVPMAFSVFLAVLLILPYGILDAAASRVEAQIEHSLTIVLNILAPETATIVSHSSGGGGPAMPMAFAETGEPTTEPAPMEGALAEASDVGSTEEKGSYEEAMAAEASPVLDEEEII